MAWSTSAWKRPLLVLKVIVERRFGDARLLGDVLHGRSGIAAVGEELEPGVEQALARIGGNFAHDGPASPQATARSIGKLPTGRYTEEIPLNFNGIVEITKLTEFFRLGFGSVVAIDLWTTVRSEPSLHFPSCLRVHEYAPITNCSFTLCDAFQHRLVVEIGARRSPHKLTSITLRKKDDTQGLLYAQQACFQMSSGTRERNQRRS